MRSFLYVLTALVVMGLAFWAYRENYATQSKISEIDALRSDIAHLTESLGVLKAEWAYLNRPDRLRELVAINFARLPLLPMQADQFAAVAQVAYPPEAVAPEDLPPELLAPQTDPATGAAPVAAAGAVVAYAVPVNQGTPRVTPRAKPATRPIVAKAATQSAPQSAPAKPAAEAVAAKPAPQKVAEVSATKPAAAKPAAAAAAKPAAAPPAKRPQTRPIETSAAVAAAMAD